MGKGPVDPSASGSRPKRERRRVSLEGQDPIEVLKHLLQPEKDAGVPEARSDRARSDEDLADR